MLLKKIMIFFSAAGIVMGTGMAPARSMIEKEGMASSDGEREIAGYSAAAAFSLLFSAAQEDVEKEAEKRPEMPELPPKPDEELKSTKDNSKDHNGTVPFSHTGLGQVIIIEGMVVFLSSLAMLYNPQVIGGFEALAFLVGFGEGEPGKPGYWPTELVTFAGFEAVAIYNIAELHREKYSRMEIFEKNFVGFNIALAMSAATAYITGYNRKLDIFARDEKKQQKLSINYVPLRDGVLLLANFEF